MRLTSSFLAACIALLCVESCVHPDVRSERALYETLAESSVLIRPDDNSSGSGTVIKRYPGGSLVLTCAHVVKLALDVKVMVDVELGYKTYDGHVQASDPERDLAIIWVPDMRTTPVLPIAATPPALYERIYLAGYPNAMRLLYAGTLISKYMPGARGGNINSWEVTGPFLPGISGGTATNSKGELVCVPEMAVNSRGRIQMEGMDNGLTFTVPSGQIGFCVPLDTIQNFLKANL